MIIKFVSLQILSRALTLSGLLLARCFAPSATPRAWAQINPPAPEKVGGTKANERGDLAFDGPGTQTGKFLELRDVTFDSKGNLYALDGATSFDCSGFKFYEKQIMPKPSCWANRNIYSAGKRKPIFRTTKSAARRRFQSKSPKDKTKFFVADV